nr:MAG TPA: hypothetical protein [Caudoviricetes sp.]
MFATYYLLGFTFDSKQIVSTWLGCPTKNILNPYCTREWWNVPFTLKTGVLSLRKACVALLFRMGKFNFLSLITSTYFLFTNQYLL